MKKMSRIAGIIGVLVSVSLLTGCIGEEADPFASDIEPDPVKPNVAEVEVDEPVEAEPEETPVEEEIDYEEIYAPIIEANIDMIEYGYNMDAENKYISSGLVEKAGYENKDKVMTEVGYVLMDINGDNVPEFFMGENADYDESGDKSYIYGAYTYKDGELVCFVEGWARSSSIWMGNGKIYYFGSMGAMSSMFGQKYLDSNCEVKWDDFYFSDENDDGTVGYYHNKTGVFDADQAEKLDMEPDKFWALYSDANYEVLKWTPLAEYKK